MKEREKLKNERMQFIIDNHELNNTEIARKLKCNLSTVRRYRIYLEDEKKIPLRKNFIEKVPQKDFDLIVDLYEKGYLMKEIMAETGYTHSQLQYILKHLRMNPDLRNKLLRKTKKKSVFDEADICYVIDFYEERKISDLALDLDVPYTTLYGLIERLKRDGKIKKKTKHNNKIKEKELEFIKENYEKMKISAIARHLDVSSFCVSYHIDRLKAKGEI